MTVTRALLPLVPWILLASCSGMPPKQESLAEYRDAQKAAAVEARQAGRLNEALALWRSLLPLYGEDADVQDAIASLETEIEKKTRVALRKANAAYRRSDRGTGDTWMLRVLALQPGQEQALEALRDSTSRRAVAVQAAKSREENELIVARMRQSERTPGNSIRRLYEDGNFQAVLEMSAKQGATQPEEISGLVRASHIALADQARKVHNYDIELYHLQAAITTQLVVNDPLIERSAKLRVNLSRNWYRRGNRLMKDNLPGAIAALEKSVNYNPENRAAQQKLRQARTMLQNLEKIKKQ